MNHLLRLLKWSGLFLLGIIGLILLFVGLDNDYLDSPLMPPGPGSVIATKSFSPEVDSSTYFQLLEEFGQNKILPPGYEYASLLALSYYPALKEVPIEFRVEPAIIPLSSRPDPITVLFPWIQRRYLVVISSKSNEFLDLILMHLLPFNDQVGVLGHELAHTIYYQDKSAWELAQIAYKYETDRNFHDQFERETDKRGIAYGLGYQLYDYAFFVRKAFGQTLGEIEGERGNTYLSPNEIAEEMEKFPFYVDSLEAPATYYQ